ncbi:MAG: FMN-binding protein [bacterium]
MRTLIASAGLLTLTLSVAGADGAGSSATPVPDSSRARMVAPPAERLVAIFPGYCHAAELAGPFPCLGVYSSADSLLGYVGWSDLAGTTARGYGGPVPVRVFVAPDGAILDFDLLDNCETPSYFRLVFGGDFRARLTAWQPGQEAPDAVSMATSSSAAIIEGVTGTVQRILAEVIGPPAEADGRRPPR